MESTITYNPGRAKSFIISASRSTCLNQVRRWVRSTCSSGRISSTARFSPWTSPEELRPSWYPSQWHAWPETSSVLGARCQVTHRWYLSSPPPLASPVWPEWAILKVFLVTNFVTKVTQMYKDFFGYFESINFQGKTAAATFGQLFKEFWLLFISASCHTGRDTSSHLRLKTDWVVVLIMFLRKVLK